MQIEHCKQLRELAIALPAVTEAHRVVGSEYYILKAVLPSMQHLEALMEQFLQLGAVEVSIVLSTLVADKALQELGVSSSPADVERTVESRKAQL